jgi:tetratricopeptide (TPR) repeat protein
VRLLNPHVMRASTGDETLPSDPSAVPKSDPKTSLAPTRPTFVVPKSTRNPLFDQTSEKAIRVAHRRKWTSLVTLLTVLGTSIGLYFWTQARKNSERELTKEFISIQAEFDKEQEAFQDTQKAAGKDADFSKSPDHTATAQKFFEFAKKHNDGNLGVQAALRASSAFIEKKDWDKAIELINDVARKTLSNTVAQSKLKMVLAKVYFEKGELPKALAELDYAVKLKDNPILDETKLLKAQVLYFNNQKKEAAELLRELANSPSMSLPELMGGGGGESQIASEAAMWLGHWGL